MNKQYLLNQLNSIHGNYILSLASIPMFKNENSNKILENFYISIGENNFDCTRILLDLLDEKSHQVLLNEFIKSAHRTLIREGSESIKQYAKSTGQYKNNIKENHTFIFASLIRNAFSHDFKIDPIGYIKRKLNNGETITWRERNITKNNIGNTLSGSDLKYSETFQLFLDLYKIVETELN